MDPQVKDEHDKENDSPVTPRKRGRKQSQTDTTMDDDTPTKKSKRTNPLGPIPATYEEASEDDKLIVHLKEKEGKSWAEIKKTLEVITGATLGGSTIPVRYGRMKANFVVFEKDDEPALLESKKEIEGKFEVEKWQKIADAIEVKRGSKYPSAAVQKKFKEMLKKGSAARNGPASPLNDEE